MLVLPNKSAAVWDRFLTENKVLVYKYIVREIKKGLADTTKDKIDLFKFEDGTMYAWIPKKEVLKTLGHAMEVFVKAEEYEYAKKVDIIIKQYHIDKLISEIKKPEE